MTDDGAAQLAAKLADELAAAHRRIRALPIEDAEKALASRRLLAISEVAKHDVTTAARRLHAFVHALDEGEIGVAEPPAEP